MGRWSSTSLVFSDILGLALIPDLMGDVRLDMTLETIAVLFQTKRFTSRAKTQRASGATEKVFNIFKKPI
jgi:hypothetical protein